MAGSVTETASAVHRLHLEGLSKKTISTNLESSLPDDFYHSPQIYQLERRAIFSRRWFLVSHKARYRNVGDYVQYEMAGFNFVVVKNKEGTIVGFHNICRHRAFPVVQESSGTARIFSCGYHGWSYDLNGKLTKAPRFTPDTVPAFDASSIRLFPVHVHVDRNGFVYVNLDAAREPEISWKTQYGDLDQQQVLLDSGVDWDTVEYDRTWVKEGAFNWKLMQDNYNECYHCLTAHPSVAKTTSLDTYYVVPSTIPSTYISHFSEPKPSVLATSTFDATRFAGRSATHVFPVGHFSPNPGTGFMHLMRSIPTSPTTTRQEYDVYRLKTPHATEEAHQRMLTFYQNVVDEDFALCEGVQRNLARGVFERGVLHPFHEEGVQAFQRMVLDVLSEQVRREEEAGMELWAAKPSAQGKDSSDTTDQATELCRKTMSCRQAKKAKGLDW
jgi:phenylpropionate dioxygenase-like ring-hydroxylating dioxygenase large terminal subunit